MPVDSQSPNQYKQKPITVSAIQWDPKMGPQFGVRERPRKHRCNPDEFYVRNRYGVEKSINPGDWVITYKDGASEIVEDGLFVDLYGIVKPTPEAESRGDD